MTQLNELISKIEIYLSYSYMLLLVFLFNLFALIFFTLSIEKLHYFKRAS